MSAENLPGILIKAKELLFGPEKPRGPQEYVFPNSSHFQQFYTPEFFEALDFQNANLLQVTLRNYLDRVQSPIIEIHQSTDSAASIDITKGKILISTSGVATIARDRVLDQDMSRLRRTILITSIDQLLASYFGKDFFQRMQFNEQTIERNGNLSSIWDNLASLAEGDRFKIIAKDRQIEVQILPLPKDENFPLPEFFIIGPKETDFQKTINQARSSSKRVIFEVKRTQLELCLAYLEKFNPTRTVITGATSSGYLISEPNQETKYSKELPRIVKRGLEFLIHAREGNVDGFVRSLKDNLNREKDAAGVFGIDVVQTGTALRDNKLKSIEPVLPIPCYPVQLKVA